MKNEKCFNDFYGFIFLLTFIVFEFFFSLTILISGLEKHELFFVCHNASTCLVPLVVIVLSFLVKKLKKHKTEEDGWLQQRMILWETQGSSTIPSVIITLNQLNFVPRWNLDLSHSSFSALGIRVAVVRATHLLLLQWYPFPPRGLPATNRCKDGATPR